MASTGVETVVRLRASGEEGRHGLRAPRARFDIARCTIIPRTSSEFTDLADTVIVGLTLVAPPDTDLLATDQVEVRGLLYQVEGVPGDYRTRRGKHKALLAALERVTG